MAKKAVEMFEQIASPDAVIFILAFNACAAMKSKHALHSIRSILDRMPEAFRMDARTQTSVIDALMKSGDVDTAERWYEQMKVNHIPAHGAMMKGEL